MVTMRTAGLCGAFAFASALVVAAQVTKVAVNSDRPENPYYVLQDWINGLFFPASFKQSCVDRLGWEGAHYLLTYLRDLLAGSALYYITAGLWHVWIYHVKGKEYFHDLGLEMPSRETILDQICLAQASMFMYAGLPVFSEWLIENGYTRCYYYIDEIGGWFNYTLTTLVYLALVELGVYWVHRKLHENKFLYKYVHGLHHKYNKPSTLSPWCSVAFNPLDGIAQASPYVVSLFIVPCHYITHIIMVFFTAVWATNIHDALEGNTEPIMGSKYHTMHHTHYHYNFGQFFIFCDYIFGTYRVPEPRDGRKAAAKTQ